MQRNVHRNTERQEVRHKGNIFGIVEKQHGQWVLEYRPIETASFAARSAQSRPDSSATADQWATPRATTQFERVHLDLIQMTEGFNGDKCVLRFLDDATRMNFVYTLPRKSFLTVTIQQFAALICRRFKYEVGTFHTDNKTALGEKFDAWIKDNGYTVEYPAPYTPGQNGTAERSGGLIITKLEQFELTPTYPRISGLRLL
jgi:transposase InsO family protein